MSPHSKLDDVERRIVRLEQRLDKVSKAVETLSAWRKFELGERRVAPGMHAGSKVIGRIPIWGSGRYLLVLKTPKGSFELDIV